MTNPIIKINVKDYGTMTAELYPEKAPKTVANFVKLAKANFFEGLIFHRVIKGFMIQGGGYTADFKEKDADSIYGEFAANGFPQNDLLHKRGVLSMARTSIPTPRPLSSSLCTWTLPILTVSTPHSARPQAVSRLLTRSLPSRPTTTTAPAKFPLLKK